MTAAPSNPAPPLPSAVPAPHRHARFATPSVSVLVSLALHAGLLALAAAIVWRTASAPSHPAANLLTLETPGDAAPAHGSPAAPAPINAPATPPARPHPHEVFLESVSLPASAPDPLVGLASATNPSTTPPPASPSAGAPGTISALVNQPATSAAPHTATPGVSGAPESVVFAGLGASSVKSVVYVVDASGPMVTSLPMVIAEVERSVSRLSPTQKFGVIVFRRTSDASAAPAFESFSPALLRPTASARSLLHDWLKRIEPSGRSSPLAGLEAALALKPDAVFLLSRSIQRSGGGVWDQGLDATLTRLDELNPALHGGSGRREVLIQTIQFLDDDPTGILAAIGENHGGGGKSYRVIRSHQDLSAEPPP